MYLPLGVLIVAGLGLTACGSSKEKEEVARADSARIADSIARAQEQIASQIAEQALQDSIEQHRQDSIAKLEDFVNKIPSFSRLYDVLITKEVSYLKSLGYKVSKKGKLDFDNYEKYPEEIYTCKYYVDADHYCTVIIVNGYGGNSTKITIVGAPEQLNKMKTEAGRVKHEYDGGGDAGGSFMEIKGNSISWGWGA